MSKIRGVMRLSRQDDVHPSRQEHARSLLDTPSFLLTVAGIFVLGQLADLLGTYIAQPNLEHEGNWLYLALSNVGIQIGWPAAIVGKSLISVLGIASLEFFTAHRRRFYPPNRLSGSALVHWFVYGRRPDEPKSEPPSSRDVRALLVLFTGYWALSGPIYLYMGYDNLAAHYGWFRFPGFFVGGVYTTWGDFFFLLGTLATLLFLIEADHHAAIDREAAENGSYAASRLGVKKRSSPLHKSAGNAEE